MNKVLLKRINMEWTIRELVEEVRSLKIIEPELFIDGSKMSIMVIK